MNNEKKWLFGPRKTTDKPVSDMGMYELALNNCFAKDHQAYFRDFSEEVSTRDIIRQIAKTLNCAEMFDEEILDNDAFDTMMYEWLEDGIEEKTGVLALLSELMWAKAELYAKLKRYEDAEERGEIGRVLVVHGRDVAGTPSLFECSVCGWRDSDTLTGDTSTYNYCPNCGAKMDADHIPDNADRCVCCGDVIPEGRQVCPVCEGGG